jgi:hypothetical protein
LHVEHAHVPSAHASHESRPIPDAHRLAVDQSDATAIEEPIVAAGIEREGARPLLEKPTLLRKEKG